MFKLSKYEIRKNILGLIIMFGAIVGIEIYFLISAFVESGKHTALSSGLLVMSSVIAYFGVLIYGVASYSKELNRKTGYMTFMTPISSFSIIGSKLFSTLIIGIFFVALLGILAVIDMVIVENVFPETKVFSDFIDVLAKAFGTNAGKIWISVCVGIFSMLIESFAIVAIAYMSITLTATIFQNKKWKGLVSVLIFILIMLAVIKTAELIPDIYKTTVKWSQAIINLIPLYIYMTAVDTACIFVSGRLLDKKVSL